MGNYASHSQTCCIVFLSTLLLQPHTHDPHPPARRGSSPARWPPRPSWPRPPRPGWCAPSPAQAAPPGCGPTGPESVCVEGGGQDRIGGEGEGSQQVGSIGNTVGSHPQSSMAMMKSGRPLTLASESGSCLQSGSSPSPPPDGQPGKIEV